jgi:3-oxoacyl-[acyl-carrier-protein] synthase II
VLRGKCDIALVRAMKAALRDAGKSPADVGHINAHGLSTTDRDADEARAIREVFGPLADKVPVTALKSYFGNLGAGSAVVELIASVLALRDGRLPRVLNYETPDPACSLALVTNDATSAGRSFLNLSVTPQGQAAVLYVATAD